jgi:hypothetical protein
VKAADSLAAEAVAAKKLASAMAAAEGTPPSGAALASAADLGRSPATVVAAKVAAPAARLDNKQGLILIL